MSLLKFYTDTNIDKQVATKLRAKRIDVVRCEDVDLAQADDETHLVYAAQHNLALITKDAGFRSRHFQWLSEERNHHGIFFCAKRHVSAIGEIVNACYAYAQLVEQDAGTLEDIQNEFFDIGERQGRGP